MTTERPDVDVISLRGALPRLRTPVLLAAFGGWNDAGECATLALDAIRRGTGAEAFADVDAEEFYDFQQTRPSVRTGSDGSRVLDWPRTTAHAAPVEGGRGDLVIVTGAEPNLRWRSYADAIVALARSLRVGLVVTVGALQVDVPHTRPVPITLTSGDAALGAELALSPSTYEGPTGITGVLHAAAAAAGLPALSMWAGVPHYLAGTPYLRGGRVLAERIAEVVGLTSGSGDVRPPLDAPLARLAREAAEQNDEIAELIAHDDELEEYVEELEARAADGDDEPVGEGAAPVEDEVYGDDLAAELERYLRGER
jgi:hypothetical protein